MSDLIERVQHELDQRELVAESMLGTGHEQTRSDIAIGKILEDCKAALSQQEAVGYVDQMCGDTAYVNVHKGQSIVAGQDVYTAPPSTPQPAKVQQSSDEWILMQYHCTNCDWRGADVKNHQGLCSELYIDTVTRPLNTDVPQSVEEFIEANEQDLSYDPPEYLLVPSDKIREFMSGKVLAPVEPSIDMLEALAFGRCSDTAIGHAAILKETKEGYEAMLKAVKGE